MITKRVVALDGDFVYRRDDQVLVQVPRGHIWIEGDNGPNSNDSNAFGAVPAGLVEAVVTHKLHPWAEAGRVERLELSRNRVIRGKKRTGADI
mmetsp:Transcript_389/g.1263  ORF Transcript_389/g.1263 Transcript_389/m.1263 type:complete len:93 (-) Transcript_389:44-322(-)